MRKMLILILALAVACDPLDHHLSTGVSRIQAFSGHGKYKGMNPDGTPVAVPADTVVYMTGVEFPESYDWVRDTAYGDVEAAIVLYRNAERVLSISTGSSRKVSADPDMHHLVEGHVYSEYTYMGQTWIKKDGSDLFIFDKAEKLRGLLVKGQDVYTLGQNKDGHGFALRKNGQAIFEKDEGRIIGMMDSDSFYRGALYEDGGSICFSYRGRSDLCSLVADGKESPFSSSGNVLDMRRIGGKIYLLEMDEGGVVSLRFLDKSIGLAFNTLGCTASCRLSVYKGEAVVIGDYGNRYTGFGSCVWNSAGEVVFQHSGKTDFYLSESSEARVHFYANTLLSFDTEDIGYQSESGRQLFFPYRSAFLYGRRFVLCTTVMDLERYPILFDNGERQEVELRGFLSSLEVMEERPQSSQET